MNEKKETNSKFKVGDLVVFHDGLFQVKEVKPWSDISSCVTYTIGTLRNVTESQLRKADWRDQTRILGKGNKAVK